MALALANLAAAQRSVGDIIVLWPKCEPLQRKKAMGRSVLPPDVLIKEADHLYDAINTRDDLGCILLATSFVDQCLATLLHKFFVAGGTSDKLLSPTGRLGEAFTRLRLAYCLGLISEGILKNLQILFEIRNTLAHSHFALGFDDEAIREQCAKLTLPSQVDSEGKQVDSTFTNLMEFPRQRFAWTAIFSSNRIMMDAKAIERRTKPGEIKIIGGTSISTEQPPPQPTETSYGIQ